MRLSKVADSLACCSKGIGQTGLYLTSCFLRPGAQRRQHGGGATAGWRLAKHAAAGHTHVRGHFGARRRRPLAGLPVRNAAAGGAHQLLLQRNTAATLLPACTYVSSLHAHLAALLRSQDSLLNSRLLAVFDPVTLCIVAVQDGGPPGGVASDAAGMLGQTQGAQRSDLAPAVAHVVQLIV